MTGRTDIHIPTIEEIARINTYGLVYADGTSLYYSSLEEKEIRHYLAATELDICGTAFHGDDLYYNSGHQLCSLSKGIQSDSRRKGIDFLLSHNGRLLDCGEGGIHDLMEKRLISHKEMMEKDMVGIQCLLTDPHDNLYALVYCHGPLHRALIEIEERPGEYTLGRKILSYQESEHQRGHSQAVIVPYGSLQGENGRNYDFSVISCADSSYLDVNGEKILGTEIEGKQLINRVACLGQLGNTVDLAYSGNEIGKIIQVRVDLVKREAIEKEILISRVHRYANALLPVNDEACHKRLLEVG